MSSIELTPITRESEICQILSCLPEKFVVDAVNGIDVVRDHLRVQRDRTGIVCRLHDGFTGQGTRRQLEINASLADGIEGALTWLTELTDSVAMSNYALAQVSEHVSTIQIAVTKLAHYSADTRQQLEQFSAIMDVRLHQMNSELSRIDRTQQAQIHLDRIFKKWAAGKYACFSYSGRCYAALEELRWGAFGDLIRQPKKSNPEEFLDDLKNRVIHQLIQDSSNQREEAQFWLAVPNSRKSNPDATPALTYMGNWSSEVEEPFVYAVTQQPKMHPRGFPHLFDAPRLGEAMVDEIFPQNNILL